MIRAIRGQASSLDYKGWGALELVGGRDCGSLKSLAGIGSHAPRPARNGTMSAAAVIALRRKRLIRHFRAAGATDREHAVALDAVGERPTWIFDQMTRSGVFQPTLDGRYFMDEAAAAAFRHRCRVRAFAGAAICLLLFLVFLLSALLGR